MGYLWSRIEFVMVSYDAIPPTNAALEYHIKRASYQAGSIWGQETTRKTEILSPSKWE